MCAWICVRARGALRRSASTSTSRSVLASYPGLAIVFLLVTFAGANLRAEVEIPLADPRDSISIQADQANQWRQGAYEVWLLRGNCQLRQGSTWARSREAVLWIDRAGEHSGRPHKIIAYLEGEALIDFGSSPRKHRLTGKSTQTLRDKSWFGRFHSLKDIELRVPMAGGEPPIKPALLQRAQDARNPFDPRHTRPAQFIEPLPAGTPEAAGPADAPSFSASNVTIRPRSSVSTQVQIRNDPVTNESIGILTNGVQVIIEGARVGDVQDLGNFNLGKIDIETDRVVVWGANLQSVDLFGEGDGQPARDLPIELYLEGNIVFRQGDRVIFAERMYYNVAQEYGVVLQAEVLTPVPEYQGLLRVKADVLQQVDRHNFIAYGAALTSSRLGVPRYWLQSDQVTIQDVQSPRTDPFTGQPVIDPITGEPQSDHDLLATSQNNFLYVGGFPVFYWPRLATDLRKPSYYINNLSIKQDNVFGFQVQTEYDAYQLFSIRNPPEGTEWSLSTDYLSNRGPAAGTLFAYDRFGLFGIPGRNYGLIDAWGIRDEGLDNLGLDRRALMPEEEWRGRLRAFHRHEMPAGYQVTAEVGWISDRNFLEQYFEYEWDQLKDQTTGIELKRYFGNSSWSVTGDVQLNEFFTQTQWLPRFDHFLMGQSLLFDRLTWYAHSSVGYADLEPATAPADPVDAAKFDPLPWEVDREGLRATTRHELDLPLQAGPVKVVPYLLGELAHWDEDISGDDRTRAYGQGGVRASLPFWKVNPDVQSPLLNLNGLAHKITFEAEYLQADANESLETLPLYDNLDDDSVEHFRRRFFFDTFGGVPGGSVPLRFDERFYALRSGMQSWVAAPSSEIADDLSMARFAVRQRWQTKRGLPTQERIVDWIVLNIEGAFYPDAERDNFGEDFGLFNYDFRWHVGDRFTVLSDGFADFFSDGLRTASLGGIISRPEVGNFYLGFRTIEGPIVSHIVTGSASYRMSEKWIATAGASFDFGPTGNIGQTLGITRIGESALIRLGFIVDESRDNVGLQLAIEPRFLPGARLGRVGGVQIPPAGAFGLE